MTTTAWARAHRRLSAKASARPGVYNPDITPWVAGIHEALDDPEVFEVNCQKSAQVAWTDGVLLNYLGRRIDLEPCPMIVMFAKDQAAKEFNSEKFEPMVEATPRLADKIPVTKSRDRNNRWQFKGFPGGFLKFVGSNSASSVKSTPAPVTAVEEPDDCNENVDGQGDTITLLRERSKTFARRKMIFGGTPTLEGFSRIASAYKASDQRKFFVPCPHCNELQVLMWENVKWASDPQAQHEIYGQAIPSTARYTCVHCGSLWTDAEKNRAVRKGHWRAEAAFHGVAGFYINELYAPFPGSTMPRLVEKFLAAQYELERGNDTKMRSFRNNTEGLPYAVHSDVPPGDELKLRAEAYEEMTVPHGGLIVTAGVDVQHDRLAVVIRAWGRGEESWLVYFGEIFGSTLNPAGGAWTDLDALLTREFRHATGAVLRLAAATIDGSDGSRTEIVNAYVRMRRHLHYMSGKGASEQTDDRREIFAPPKKVDTGRNFRAAKRGLEVFIVGVNRAKDLILENRVKLAGSGPGRMHWYATVRPDYWEQLTSEVKAPSATNRNRKVWKKKAGVRNEGLDAEVYALHAARSVKTNLMHEHHWVALERRLLQRGMFSEPEPTPAPTEEQELDDAVSQSGDAIANEATSVHQVVDESPASDVQAPAPPAPAPAPAATPTPPVKRRAPRPARSGGFATKW